MMEIKINERDGIPILEVWGDLQYTNWKEFVTSANELFAQGEKQLVVSWEHTDYIDSSAMGALVTIHKIFKSVQGGKVVVFTPHEDHMYILTQTHFNTFLQIRGDLESALKCFINVNMPHEAA